MVLVSQTNKMVRLQERYVDNPNPIKRLRLYEPKKDDEAENSMDEDDFNRILSTQLANTSLAYESENVKIIGASQRVLNENSQIFKHTPIFTNIDRQQKGSRPATAPGNISAQGKPILYSEQFKDKPPVSAQIPPRVSIRQPIDLSKRNKYCQTDNLCEEESALKNFRYEETHKKTLMDLNPFLQHSERLRRFWELRNIIRSNANNTEPIGNLPKAEQNKAVVETLSPMRKCLLLEEPEKTIHDIYQARVEAENERRGRRQYKKKPIPSQKRLLHKKTILDRRFKVPIRPAKKKPKLAKDPNDRFGMISQS